jgi:hypothetical protein
VELSERKGALDRIDVSTESVDRNMTVRMRGRGGIELRFAPSAYESYDATVLGRQLSQLATLTWVAYRRAYFAAVSEEVGQTIRGDERSGNPAANQFRDDVAALTLSGRSTGGWVSVTSAALVRWEFSVRPGACARLSEQEFIGEVHSTVSEVLDDYDEQVREVLAEMSGAPGDTGTARG